MNLIYKLMLVSALLFLLSGKIYANDSLSEKQNLAIIIKRQETISQLIINFKKSNDKEYKRSILYTLGKLRAKTAISFLIKNIDYGISGPALRIPKYGTEPAEEALSKIGAPAISPILNSLKISFNRSRLYSLTNALVGINGHDLAIFYLQKEIKKTKNSDYVAKLKKALQIVVRYAPKEKWYNKQKNNSLVFESFIVVSNTKFTITK